jgi:cytochrome c biogenesis protein CcmG/thiol:disulfide interchange protein DsbE
VSERSRGRRVVAPVIAVVVAVVVGLLVWVFAHSSTAQNDTAKTPLMGKAAPVVQSQTLDGKDFDLGSLRGSWVALNFFATWCPPCQQEHADLVRFEQAQGANGVKLVSIVNNDTDDNVRQFFAGHGGTWPVVRDPDGRIAVAFGVAKVPETWLVDPDGVVVARVASAVTADGLTAIVQRAQEQRSGVGG